MEIRPAAEEIEGALRGAVHGDAQLVQAGIEDFVDPLGGEGHAVARRHAVGALLLCRAEELEEFAIQEGLAEAVKTGALADLKVRNDVTKCFSCMRPERISSPNVWRGQKGHLMLHPTLTAMS